MDHSISKAFPLLLALLMQPLDASPGTEGVAGETQVTVTPRTLPQLAARADFVGVIQVADTDYEYTRGFPSGGSAFLRILVPYKVTRPQQGLLEVYEEGLHEYECYFPNPTVFEEGRRYLVFLRTSEDVPKQYNGLEQGCALEVLVTADNRYAVRYPLDGMLLAHDHTEEARPIRFADSYAVLDEEALAPDRRNALLEDGWLARSGERYRYTHGIPLSRVRALIGSENLMFDRALKAGSQDTMR